MDWIEPLKSFGLPTVIILAGGFGFWRVMQWAANNVVKPLIDRHIKFLDKLEQFMQSTSESMQRVSDNQTQLAEAVKNILERQHS